MLSVFAGQVGGRGNLDGTGTNAWFYNPEDVAVDTAGNLFVADRSNQVIRKITSAGVVTTFAGVAGKCGAVDGAGSAAEFCEPSGITIDGAGNLYVTDFLNSTIRKITSAGVVSTIAGVAGPSDPVDGTGPNARFNSPYGIVLDAAGNLYVTDSGADTIRKITPAGVVSTVYGATYQAGSTDGVGVSARFSNPRGIAIDAAGNLYVADAGNNIIRKITSAGVVSTLAGSGQAGSVDGSGTSAQFLIPFGITVDATGNLYVTEQSFSVRKITPVGNVTTFAGVNGQSGSVDGDSTTARFSYLYGVTVDSAGNLYVADGGNNSIRKITSTGVVSTVAGAVAQTGTTNGTGTTARFNDPQGVAVDATGNLFVADVTNNTIREITSAGVVSTFAGSAGQSGSSDGTGTNAQFYGPCGVTVDANGNLYVAELYNHTIRKITSAGVVTTLAGSAGHAGSVDGTGSSARFDYPTGVVVDGAGNVYVTDAGNATIRKITSAGVVSTLAGSAGAYDSVDGTGSDARFENPIGIVMDGAGNLYVADASANNIRKVTSAGVVTTLAGSGQGGAVDGSGANAQFNGPSFITLDSAGNLYLADNGNNTIRKITPTGMVTTVVGRPGIAGFTAGALPGVIARPGGIAVYGTTLYATMDNAVIKVASVP